jgi:hypothetical protein
MWKLNFFNKKKPTEPLPESTLSRNTLLENTLSGSTLLEHNHTWALVARTYARPRRDIPTEMLKGEVVEKLLFGVTTLVWECASCGNTRQEFLLGSDQDTLDEVLDKVDEFGNQVVVRGENKYVVNRFIQPQLINGIPLR